MKSTMLVAVLCLSFLVLAQAPRAAYFSGLGSSICNILFGQSASGIGALANANYTYVLQIAFLIVVVMFAVIGIAYALGTALGIDVLKNFSRTEALESFFNLIIIVLLVPGLVAVNGVSGFLANLGVAAISPLSPQIAAVSTQSTAGPLMQPLCINYMTFGVERTLTGVISLLPSLYEFQNAPSVLIQTMPNGFGFSDTPFAGLYPFTQFLNLEVEAFLAIGGIMSAVGVFLFVIYFIFPVFLYAGILLRSFTWTRAAGGSLLATFISFYVIFPALIYPFSVQLAQPSLQFNPQSGSAGTPVSLSGDGYAPNTQFNYCLSSSSSDTSQCISGTTGAFLTDSTGSIPSRVAGFVNSFSVPNSNCPSGEPYAFENTCGDPSSFSGVCSASESPSCVSSNVAFTLPSSPPLSAGNYYILVYSGSAIAAYQQINVQSGGGYTTATNCGTVLSASSVQNTAQYACLQTGIKIGGAVLAGGAVYYMTSFISEIEYSVLQVFGVLIAFIISFDLLERFGDLLGAPSLSSGKIMHKVI